MSGYYLNPRHQVSREELPKDLSASEAARWRDQSRWKTGVLFGPKPVKIVVIDFDGTIAFDSYPAVGAMKPMADVVINSWYERGHMILIDTCRTSGYQAVAEDALKEWGIKYHYINTNLPEQIALYGADCRKLSGHLRIDDIQLGGIPGNWETIAEIANLQ